MRLSYFVLLILFLGACSKNIHVSRGVGLQESIIKGLDTTDKLVSFIFSNEVYPLVIEQLDIGDKVVELHGGIFSCPNERRGFEFYSSEGGELFLFDLSVTNCEKALVLTGVTLWGTGLKFADNRCTLMVCWHVCFFLCIMYPCSTRASFSFLLYMKIFFKV